MGARCGCCTVNDADEPRLAVVNTDPRRMEHTDQKHNETSASHDEINEWLGSIDEQFSNKYHHTFVRRGYRTLDTIATIQNINELLSIGIQKQHTTKIMRAIQEMKMLLQSVYRASNRTEHKYDTIPINHDTNTIREWLTSIHKELAQYCANFIQNGYTQYGFILQIQSEKELHAIGIRSAKHSRLIMDKIIETKTYDGNDSKNTNEHENDSKMEEDSVKDTSQKPSRNYNLNEAFQDNVQSLSLMHSLQPLFRTANDDHEEVLEQSWKCPGCGSMNFYRRKKCQLCANKLPSVIIDALKLLSQSNYEIIIPSYSAQQQLMTDVNCL